MSAANWWSVQHGYNVAIFGHSYITRLEDYERRNSLHGLNLYPNVVQNFAWGGAWAPAIQDSWHSFLLDFTPAVCIFQVGGNEISGGVSPILVAQHIRSMVDSLITNYRVSVVVVCEELDRYYEGVRRRGIDASTYRIKVREMNKIVREFCEPDDRLLYWDHRDITHAPPARMYDGDGVHLDWDVGYSRYWRSLRGAAITAVRKIDILRF